MAFEGVGSGTAESYWMESTESTTYPRLASALEVDVAVVGGGIVGIATAWELARAGRSVAVLEADRIVAGTTGYTTAKLTAQHTLIYDKLRSTLGTETARLYAASQQAAVEHVVSTAEQLGIECELERRPAYTYVTSTKAAPSVQAEAEAARDAGLPAEYVETTPLPFAVAGAVRVANQAQFHPRKYLLALADDLCRRGGVIFERTRVVELDEGEPCRLTTDDGQTVRARDVIIATHYPVFDRALLFSRLVPHRELVVAAPIAAAFDPAGMYITPEENTRSVRTAPYREGERLLIVTGESFKPGDADVTGKLARLAEWTRSTFAVEKIGYRWAAQDNATTDRLPYVGPFHAGAEHTFVATGFGGWGMSNGIMASRLLTALITDAEKPEWTDLYDPRRVHPIVEAPQFFKAQAAVAKHYVGDRLRPSHADTVSEIPPGSGAIVRVGGERCAVYRDDDGAVHTVSATCTHLGCLVHFNDAERTWDCPCHGSRFGTDGEVLHGPANRPLDRVEAPIATE